MQLKWLLGCLPLSLLVLVKLLEDLKISNFRNHTASCVTELSATYSASDVDNATTACFLLNQLIGPPVIKKRLPVVEGGHHIRCSTLVY